MTAETEPPAAGDEADATPTEIPSRDSAAGRELALALAKLCGEYRTEETVVLDLTAVTPVFDFFVVTTGTNPRQMNALADQADQAMKAAGSPRLGTEGHTGRQWILHDYGDVVLHILSPEARSNYDLEGLWADATRVEFETGEPAPAAADEPADAPEA